MNAGNGDKQRLIAHRQERIGIGRVGGMRVVQQRFRNTMGKSGVGAGLMLARAMTTLPKDYQ